MFEFFLKLFDTSDFLPRRLCGNWTEEHIWLHMASDALIWLAYVSIPMLLIFFAYRRQVPFHRIFFLFAAFILACGFTHLVDTVTFYTPVYRLLGLLKFITAAVSCATVLALVPTLPRALAWLDQAKERLGPIAPPARSKSVSDDRLRQYIVAVLAAVLAMLVRRALDEFLNSDHVFVLSLLAVVAVAWQGGFGPALVTLVLTLTGTVYFFVQPRFTFVIASPSDQIAVGLFFFCGFGAALMGEAQRTARRQAEDSLADTIRKQAALEAEIARRLEIEVALRQREADLMSLNRQLSATKAKSDETVAVLDAFLQNAPVGMAFFDKELRYVHVNKSLADVNRLPIEAHLGKTARETMPAYPEELLSEFEAVLTTGQVIMNRVVGLEGSETGEIWQLNLFPVRRDGESIGLGVIAQAVTERFRTEERLRDSEARFRTLAETAPLFVWTTRLDGTTDYFNQSWYDYTGLNEDQSLGTHWSKPLHTNDRGRAVETWNQAMLDESLFEIEYRFRRHDGAYRWFLGRGQPQRDLAGKVTRWVGTCTDIHDQKTYAEALRKSEERYRRLTQAVPQMVWVADASAGMTFFNQRWVDYTGLTIEQGRGGGWTVAVHPDDLPGLTAARKAAFEGRAASYQHEYRLRRAGDGAFRWMLSRAVPLRDDHDVTEWVGTLTDIDDQRRSAERLEQMVRDRTAELSRANELLRAEVEERGHAEDRERAVAIELARSNQELEQFAYIASHDLQEPLRKIQAFGDRLRQRSYESLAEQGRDYIDRMLYSAVRMRRLIDDLLLFSRITTKPQTAARIDLDQILEGVLDDLEVGIEKAGAVVEVEPLPLLEADPSQMRQLFQNLIGNALKFVTPNSSPRIRIFAERESNPPTEGGSDPTAEWWRISFQDNGIGFEEKYTDRIFQVFQRLHGRHEYEGTGVGLAICRKIVERHGGIITARSRPGEGATFIVTLPAIQRLKAKESSHG